MLIFFSPWRKSENQFSVEKKDLLVLVPTQKRPFFRAIFKVSFEVLTIVTKGSIFHETGLPDLPNPCVKIIFWVKLFFTSYISWHIGTFEFIIFIMHTHWDAINDFMMGRYFRKRLDEYYPQCLARFVEFLANPSDQT